MKAAMLIASAVVAASGTVFASIMPATTAYNLDGTPLAGYSGRTPVGVSYSVYTGITNSGTGALFTLEAAAANADLRTFGGAPSALNPYVAAAGGITRQVSDSTVANGGGGFDLTITVDGSGNLFPSGFTSGGTALTGAGVGLGINLGALGNSPLVFPPENVVTSATLLLNRASGTNGLSFNLPVATFFGNPAAWNGIVGVSVSNVAIAANATDPFVEVVWQISTVPAPTSIGVLGLGGLLAARRRR